MAEIVEVFVVQNPFYKSMVFLNVFVLAWVLDNYPEMFRDNVKGKERHSISSSDSLNNEVGVFVGSWGLNASQGESGWGGW